MRISSEPGIHLSFAMLTNASTTQARAHTHTHARPLRRGVLSLLSNTCCWGFVCSSELSQENWELLQENERAGTELALMREERAALDSAYSQVGCMDHTTCDVLGIL